MKRTVWIQHRPGQLDSATAREGNVLSPRWWEDGLRAGGTVIEIEYDDSTLEATVRKHYRADGSEVGIPAGEHRVMGVASASK